MENPTPPLRAFRNDSGSLTPARLGEWTPTKRVSVVVPAFGGQDKLDLVLASLAAQTYPADLLEAVVVDDGSEPPLRLPDVRPAATRIVPNRPGRWGIAAAVDAGVAAAEGELIVRLDSDVVAGAHHVEAHARWHEFGDYFAVIGKLAFVDIDLGADPLDPGRVREAVAAGRVANLFAGRDVSEDWEVALVKESGGVVEDPVRAFTIANGATISFTRAMYDDCGGTDATMPLGSDTDLGYRMAQQGAFFTADAEATAWHLGMSQMKARREEGKRYRRPFAANRIPSLRHLRAEAGRAWETPYVRVVVDADGARLEPVRATVNAVLSGAPADIEVVLTGPWASLTEERVAPLEDPLLNLRLIRETFRGDARVRFLERTPATVAPVPFQLALAPGAVPRPDGVEGLVRFADERRLGRVETAVPSRVGPLRVRLDRTAALARAERLREPGEDLDAVLDAVWGVGRAEPGAWFLTEDSKAEARRREMIANLKAALARLEGATPAPVQRSLPRRAAGRLRRLFG
jgi:GT2 family glycosyltransferase